MARQCDRDEAASAGPGHDAEGRFLVNDFTAKRYVLDAFKAGVPKGEVAKWVVDLSRNFYVKDDQSFAAAWWELRHKWEKSQRRRCLKRRASDSEVDGATEGMPSSASASVATSAPPAARGCRARSTGDTAAPPPLPDYHGEWFLSKRQVTAQAAKASTAARRDVADGRCASYDQALAARLILALGGRASGVWEERASGAEIKGAGGFNEKAAKQLLRLVHPDKTDHPCAKEAFQRLAPILRAKQSAPASEHDPHSQEGKEAEDISTSLRQGVSSGTGDGDCDPRGCSQKGTDSTTAASTCVR